MNDDPWIIVPNWDRFQHYKDREPIWIKVYSELNSRDDWRRLPYSERGLLVSIWIEFGRSRGQLSVSTVSEQCGQRVRSRSLQALSHAGWIQLSASKPLALSRARASSASREERREEKNARAREDEPRPNANAYRPPEHADHDPDRLPIAHVLQNLASDSELAATWVARHDHHTTPDPPDWTATEDEPF
jgi:hypothetical protein